MKIVKSILFILVFFAFYSIAVHAQNSNAPKQIKILNNYGAIPFEDGKTIIAEIKFIGLDSDFERYGEIVGRRLSESDLRKMLREQRATINADDKFYGSKVSKIVKALKDWVVSNGYLESEIVAFGETLPKNRMNLVFSIKRGAAARVSEIRFEGNTNVTGEELVENFIQASGDSWKIYDKRKYEYYARKHSLGLMFSKGYFQARINRITPRRVGGNYVVTIAVEEGIRYRIGKIKIEGEKVFTADEILEMLGQNEGDIANGETLQEFVYEKLKKVYADKGYVSYWGEFDPKFNKPQAEGLDAIVDILITIDEGLLFRLANIKFVGIEQDKAAELRDLFSLKDGEAYSQSKIEDGIKKINEMKKFYFVDKDRDVEITIPSESPGVYLLGVEKRPSTESSDIYLVVKVKEIN